MEANKGQKAKLYIIIGLSIVLVISGYLRIIQPKLKRRMQTDVSQPSIQIPEVQTPASKESPSPSTPRRDFLPPIVRDIFAEPAAPENPVEVTSKKPPPTTLKGTIVGGSNPIAIINDLFFRIGDPIGDFRVVQITKDSVRLRSGTEEIVLEVLKHAHP